MGDPISVKASVSTFQQCDGNNFTTAGVDTSVKTSYGTYSVYAGIGTEFTLGSTGGIFDLKGNIPTSNEYISYGFRVRNNINPNSQSVQFRLHPCNVTVPITDKTKFYATPYALAKVDYKTGNVSGKIGGFAGFSTKVGKASVFVEGQIYDVTNVNAKTASVNAGVSIPLF